ncbi:hypothetical protein TWF694_001516 [Orbilia ellipsospora]|uniref:PQ loop repeat protein n=1 Tax=Orbilia ellipsospora TaxID=2528407 RepID=A0AAV9XRV7_9PEZI
MFYSNHDLCDQIRPEAIVFLVQLIPFFLIPIPEILQYVRITEQKSTKGISPTAVLLRFLFCTVNFGNALTIPYTFAAAECCQKSESGIASCALNMLVVVHAGFLWLCNAISTIVFLFYYKDPKPRLVSSASGDIRISAGTKLYPPWTPDHSLISTVCLVSSITIIPISLFYIIPLSATTDSYWYTLEGWSFGLNISAAALAFVQGLPQATLTGRILLRQRQTGHEAGFKDDNSTMKKLEFLYLSTNSLKWFVLAGVWTTWFGGRLYANINFYLPVLWIVGAQVYLNYLIVAVEDAILAWVFWFQGTSGSKKPVEANQADTPNERTPLLPGGIRWHDDGGEQWDSGTAT